MLWFPEVQYSPHVRRKEEEGVEKAQARGLLKRKRNAMASGERKHIEMSIMLCRERPHIKKISGRGICEAFLSSGDIRFVAREQQVLRL